MKKERIAEGIKAIWFNMQSDSSVLIGEEFWNLIGGEGTYQTFIDEINRLGETYRNRIYREFLCIEPPETAMLPVLH